MKISKNTMNEKYICTIHTNDKSVISLLFFFHNNDRKLKADLVRPSRSIDIENNDISRNIQGGKTAKKQIFEKENQQKTEHQLSAILDKLQRSYFRNRLSNTCEIQTLNELENSLRFFSHTKTHKIPDLQYPLTLFRT